MLGSNSPRPLNTIIPLLSVTFSSITFPLESINLKIAPDNGFVLSISSTSFTVRYVKLSNPAFEKSATDVSHFAVAVLDTVEPTNSTSLEISVWLASSILAVYIRT